MLAKLLRDALAASASRPQPPTPELLAEVWPTLLGEPLCHRTRPVAWRDKTLVIAVASEAWRKELGRNRRALYQRFGLLPWPVTRIEFVVESMARPPAQPAHATHPTTSTGSTTSAPSAPDSSSGASNESTAELSRPLDPQTHADLERLDDDTRALMLKIRAHIDRENPG